MPPLSPDAARERAKIAILTRHGRPADDPDLVNARRDFLAAKAEDYIRGVLASAPPLTEEQRTRLAELFRTDVAAQGIS